MDLIATHSHACILALCTDPCLHPGPHLKDRVRVTVDQHKPKKKDEEEALFGTWLALGAEWVTIGKYDDTTTLVYLPSQDAFYYASPGCMLSPHCPAHTVFLGQFVVDSDASPRVLIHDLVRLQGASLQDLPARERYACLQQMAAHLGERCTVQWAGECRVLAGELRSGRFKVPHAVRSVIALTSVPGRVLAVADDASRDII